MSVRMKLRFESPPAESANKTFARSFSSSSGEASEYTENTDNAGDSLEERKADFKNDEELMRETTKFVSEVIETARLEAIKRAELQQQQQQQQQQQNAAAAGAGTKANGENGSSSTNKFKGNETLAGWNNRARGIANRVWNAVCPCFQNNELLAWTQPFRYRFTRP